ncbi:MAG: peroxiredoxin-like family protein [Phycisphaerales bacterium]
MPIPRTVAMLTALTGLALFAPAFAPDSPKAGAPADTPAASEGKLVPRTGLPVGWKAPDIELRTAENEPVKVSDLLAKSDGPVVLIFYRGGWCPFCMKHLGDIEKHLDELKALGATVVAVSPESPAHVAQTIEKIGAEYTVLSDPEMAAAMAYNLIFDVDPDTQKKYRGYGIELEDWNANGEWKLPVPALYVLDKDGVVRWAHVDEDYRKRVKGSDVVAAVREVKGKD